MSSAIDSANQQSANMGDHPVTRDVLNLAIDCQHGVNRAVTTLNNLAAGVVAVADSYVERDDFARSVFDSIRRDLGLSEELGDSEAPPVEAPGDQNRDHTLEDGAPAGPRVNENPDAASPEDDLEDRDDRTEQNQDDIGIPDY